MVRCPSCSRECSEAGRFCPNCAAPLDATSVETVVLGSAALVSQPRLTSTSTVDEGRFLPGTVVAGRYRIAGLLGRGGMGEVYRATDLTLGQAVALKFLPEATAQDERALARFYNEVRIARQVTHPNVCRVYDVGVAEGLHYISMEFVDGEDLGSLLRRIGRLPVDKGVETARKLCAGLAAAHEKGVLHRDLKPANVMIDGRGQVVIMDFGLAGLAEQLQGDVRSGTPAYMSPEQLAGTEVTIKSDVYALGLLLYEIFTGKRAFEASSLMELMQMQEAMAPASITSVARDVDPAVEKVILRCLNPDPKLRPASALTVAAGLPGGDPLAAALAAGETPSPDVVAAAGETEGLEPRIAVAWLAAALLLLGVTVLLAPPVLITSKLNLDASPEALARDARVHLRTFGYTAKAADSAWGLEYATDFQAYARSHPAQAEARLRNPGTGQPPLIRFWYRESPEPLSASQQFNVQVAYGDPALDQSGMVRLKLDTEGRLLALEAVPNQIEQPSLQPPPFDWNLLFQAAGLDAAAFQAAEPAWTALASWDARAAWLGKDAATGARLRVEAAAWRGRPVFFQIIGPWTVPGRMPGPRNSNSQTPILVVVWISLAAAIVLGRRSLKSARADLRGATRLSLILFACQSVSILVAMHHTTTLREVQGFWAAVCLAGLNAALNFMFYVALEPWVRRKWPRTMIGWTRYTARGIHDPLVGRDLLYGIVFGLVLNLGDVVTVALHGNSHQLLSPPLSALMGLRAQLAAIIMALPTAIFSVLLFTLMLFLLRLLLRKEWLAGAAFVVIITFATSPATTTPWIDYPVAALAYAAFTVALLRFGLLAAIVVSAAGQVLILGSVFDSGAWYAGMAAAPFLVIALLAIFGYRISLGGRTLFKPEP